ncbi:MAG: tRNA pseudouridine(55) synthase TruB [Thermomicrobiales bacterium]
MANTRSGARLHGFVVVDKPASWTSHDVVGWMRRLLGERQIGHAGTLDPAATGVLPVGVGYATRLMEYLSGTDKAYLAKIRLGIETDSLDGDGRVVATADSRHITAADIEAVLASWLGPKLQDPPMHSAIRVNGKRLYEHARQGQEVERPLRSVTFHRLELRDWSPPDAAVFVECSKGTYVRSLARDIGRDLGTGAYLANLVRNRTGPFCLSDAWTLAEIQQRWESEGKRCWAGIAFHPDSVISDWPVIVLDEAAEARWQTGQALPSTSRAAGSCRAFNAAGDWLGIGMASDDDRAWRPTKVAGAD